MITLEWILLLPHTSCGGAGCQLAKPAVICTMSIGREGFKAIVPGTA